MKSSLTIFSIATFIMLFVSCAPSDENRISLSRNTIQEKIETNFPIEKNILVAMLTLDSPDIYFKDTMIGLKMNVAGNYLQQETNGAISFLAVPEYHKGKFYLSQFKIDEINFADIKISNDHEFVKIIEELISQNLKNIPIYELDENNFKESLAKLFLKRVEVENNELVFVLK